MRLNSARAAIVLGCLLILSACDTEPANQAGYGNSDPIVAIGAASVTLIGATADPCKLDPADPFWKQHGGQDGYEQHCGRPPN